MRELELDALLANVCGAERPTPDAGTRDLARLSAHAEGELQSALSLGRAAARRLAAAFELGRRVERARFAERPSLRTPERVWRLMTPELRGAERELFYALQLDSKHRLNRMRLVSVGTLTTSLVHPREVFGPALSDAAAALIVVHNHPSGDPSPSQEDVEITKRLIEVGRLLGVPLLDHVVVGEGRFVSLRERLDFR